jgi:hypothetical protein
MPFTLSHPAAVLPIARRLARWRLLSAVIIGSMVPDFGWVSPWGPSRPETHSAKALLIFCLPAGLAAYWLFQWTIKTPLVELLPPGAYARCRDFALPARVGDLKQWALAAGGVLFGAITHLIWDAFTHEGARGMRMIPELSDPVIKIGGHHLAGANLLENASSVIGLLVVIAFLVYALRPSRPADANARRRLSRHERRTWLGVYLLVAAALSGVFFLIERHGAPKIYGVLLHVGAGAISILRGTSAALLLVSLGLGARLRMRPDSRGLDQ